MTFQVKLRPGRLAIGLCAGLTALAMGFAVDAGLTRGWPGWARGLWVAGILLGILSGVLLSLMGAGVISEQMLRDTGTRRADGRRLTLWHFAATYVGVLAGAAVVALWLRARYAVEGESAMLGALGAVFVASALGWPWWLYETVRRVGWFAAVTNDRAMRVLLTVLGGGFLVAAYMNR